MGRPSCMRLQELRIAKASTFKRLVGVTPALFEKMYAYLSAQQSTCGHKFPGGRRGPRPKLCMEDQLLMMLMCYREYRTFLHIGHHLRNSRVTSLEDHQPDRETTGGKQAFCPVRKEDIGASGQQLRDRVGGCERTPGGEAQKEQRANYSDKRKRHTLKSQLVVDSATGKIICAAVSHWNSPTTA